MGEIRRASLPSLSGSQDIKIPRVFLLLVLGVMTFAKVELIGQLMVSEIFILAYFVINGNSIVKYSMKSNSIRKIIFFLVLYFISQVFTDLVMNTSINDELRGWSKIIIFGINLITLFYLIEGKIRYLIFLGLGIGVGQTIVIFFDIGIYSALWKFGWGPTLSMLLVLLLSSSGLDYRKKAFLIIGLGVFHFFMNARSLGGITIVSGGLLVIPSILKKQIDIKNILNIKQLVLGGLFLFLFLSGYSFLASNGVLGAEAKEKYEMQTRNGENILLGGRGEYMASIPAIMDSPILGHGSWAKNPKYVKSLLIGRGEDYADPKFYEMIRSGLIPTHSHLLGAWVEAGVLGFIFWFFVLKLTVQSLLLNVKLESLREYPMVSFFLLTFIWDLAFSPFGLERRIMNSYFIIIAIISAQYAIAKRPTTHKP